MMISSLPKRKGAKTKQINHRENQESRTCNKVKKRKLVIKNQIIVQNYLRERRKLKKKNLEIVVSVDVAESGNTKERKSFEQSKTRKDFGDPIPRKREREREKRDD